MKVVENKNVVKFPHKTTCWVCKSRLVVDEGDLFVYTALSENMRVGFKCGACGETSCASDLPEGYERKFIKLSRKPSVLDPFLDLFR